MLHIYAPALRRLRPYRQYAVEAVSSPQVAPGYFLQRPLGRESAKTRSWEQAEYFARKMETDADPTVIDSVQPRRATVAEAVRMFLGNEEARGLEEEVPNFLRASVPALLRGTQVHSR
jgi:hypothetical protein